MKRAQDMWGDEVYIGDTVIASRPAGAGTTHLSYCRVKNITEKSVTLTILNRDGTDWEPRSNWDRPHFSLTKNYGRDNDQCKKIVKHQAYEHALV